MEELEKLEQLKQKIQQDQLNKARQYENQINSYINSQDLERQRFQEVF